MTSHPTGKWSNSARQADPGRHGAVLGQLPPGVADTVITTALIVDVTGI